MKHLFVPYEIAKLLRKKAFDEPCLANYYKESSKMGNLVPYRGYPDEGDEDTNFSTSLNSESPSNTWIAAPLYQQVIDWFREKHGIHIRVDFGSFGSGKTPTEIEFGYYYADVWYYYSNPRRIKVNWEGDETQFRGAMPIKNLTWYQVADMAIEEAFKLINI